MSPPTIDVGILTIREDEFAAVLKAFPDNPTIYRGRHREYALRTADAGQEAIYRLAILRQIEQGNGEAQEAARDLYDDLHPSLILVVGIAGGLPSDDITLGDVVLSTRVHDFSVEARKFREDTSYNVGGGPIDKALAAGIANLAARELELGDWWSGLPPRPEVTFTRNKLYGPADWQRELRGKLQVQHGKNVPVRPPRFSAGPIASSDRLVKDPLLLFPWIKTARGILAIEMESAGVHRATRDKTPMVSVRGLSDIVGLKRLEAWTKYACASAAAFTRAYLRTQPVPLVAPAQAEGIALSESETVEDGDDLTPGDEEGFANLALVRHFPGKLYVAPSSCNTRKQAWFVLNQGLGKRDDRIPGAWTIYEGNLYSFVDPERSKLKKIIDVGGLDQFDTTEWAFSTSDSKRRLFVQMLNMALREDLWNQGVRFHGDQEVYAFMGSPDDPPKKLKYPNLKVRSTATIVAHYQTKPKTGKPYKYLRHTAFQGRFRWLGEQWYLEITPTYRFTRNGKDLDRYHESRLSGIKRLERNRSVLSQLLQWQAVLRAPWTRSDCLRLLEFAPLDNFRFSSGVDESALTALDVPVARPSSDEELDG
jgi:nucleoside phosphorylase